MKTQIVAGFAGSGKSTYLGNNFGYSDVFFHDYWAKKYFESDAARKIIKAYTLTDNISKEDLIEELSHNEKFYYWYTEVGKQEFMKAVNIVLRDDKIDAIEIPFLHPEMEVLKERYDIEIVFMNRDIKDCINSLKHDRRWTNKRINMTIPRQVQNYVDYGHLVDRFV